MADAITLNSGRAAQAARSPLKRRSPLQRKAFPYLLVAPAVIYLLSITFYPGLYAMYQSLFRVRFNSWTFIGLDNYTKLLSDQEFWASLWNTFLMGSGALLLEFVIALTLAAFAYRDPFIRSWRILFLLPMLFMPSAVSFIWKLAFNDGRVVSDLLMRVGFIERPLDFLGDVWLARLSLIITEGKHTVNRQMDGISRQELTLEWFAFGISRAESRLESSLRAQTSAFRQLPSRPTRLS